MEPRPEPVSNAFKAEHTAANDPKLCISTKMDDITIANTGVSVPGRCQ